MDGQLKKEDYISEYEKVHMPKEDKEKKNRNQTKRNNRGKQGCD